MNKLKKTFKTDRPVIGMIHFMPLLGYKDYSSIDTILKKALSDVRALEEGGVDGILVENNYDVPHKIFVGPETIACMTFLTDRIVNNTKLPVGVSVLWNDYKAALSIAKVTGAKFIRVPVFVDSVKTQYGIVKGNANDTIAYRKKIKAQDVLLLTDIHVKHSVLLDEKSIEQSAQEAVIKGSDGLVVTGTWTGDAPLIDKLKRVRNAVGAFPILVGSGATVANVASFLSYSNGVIVGTAFKTGRREKNNVNIKDYNEGIDRNKVVAFTGKVKIYDQTR